MRNDIDAAPPIMRLFGGVNDSILLRDDLLGRIGSPTLFVWGADDPFGGEAVGAFLATA